MKVIGGLRFRICPDCGEMHDRDDWPDNHRHPGEVLSAPNVISDVMDPIQCQASGVIHDSKSNLRKGYKRLGMVEVGNDPARHKPKPKLKPDRKAIRDSLEKATARFNRGERVNPHS